MSTNHSLLTFSSIVHDFFHAQPITDAAVFLLRVVLHDWPDAFAQRILRHLRASAQPHTVLVIAEFILPLACVDDLQSTGTDGIEGAERTLAPSPLLANLGKANANAFWMDLTVRRSSSPIAYCTPLIVLPKDASCI